MTSSDVLIRNATREDFIAFCGEPPSHTVRAVVAEKDGKPIGIGGVLLIDGNAVIFSDIKEEMKRYKWTFFKVAKRIIEMAKTFDMPIGADAGEPTSPALLTRLGFVRSSKGVYIWRG